MRAKILVAAAVGFLVVSASAPAKAQSFLSGLFGSSVPSVIFGPTLPNLSSLLTVPRVPTVPTVPSVSPVNRLPTVPSLPRAPRVPRV